MLKKDDKIVWKVCKAKLTYIFVKIVNSLSLINNEVIFKFSRIPLTPEIKCEGLMDTIRINRVRLLYGFVAKEKHFAGKSLFRSDFCAVFLVFMYLMGLSLGRLPLSGTKNAPYVL